MPIDLSQWDLLHSATLEVRYDSAPLIWDHTGALWQTVKKKYPGLKVETASPHETKVNVDEKSVGIVGIEKAICAVSEPKADLRELIDFSSVFFPALLAQLDIQALTRVGFLVQYSKTFQVRKEAADFISSQVSLPQPTGKRLNVSGRVIDPEFVVRYEDDALGFRLRIMSQEIIMNLKLPPEFRDLASARSSTRSVASLEIDYYAHGSMPTAMFDAPTLIEGWLHLIRRDIGKVLS